MHSEKIDKYRKQLLDYEPEIREWLVSIYNEHGKHMHRNIGNIIKENEFFFLFDSESEFRNISYDCYSKLIKKFPFLKDQTEMLFLFIKEYHRIQSEQRTRYCEIPAISDEITEWIEKTRAKHQVNLLAFVSDWLDYFYDSKDIWPASHKKKSSESWKEYDYDYKQKSNLFNLDSLYRKMPKKSFTKGRKQELEILMMHYWLHDMIGDLDYWQEYIEKGMPSLNQSSYMPISLNLKKKEGVLINPFCEIEKLKKNLFKASHPAIESWDDFPWHRDSTGKCDTYKPHSSQALTIDVFGTIKASKNRDQILDYIAYNLGLPTGAPWQIKLEWIDKKNNYLKEKHKTQVDVFACSPKTLIFFECKFTERDGGACSQVYPIKSGAHKGIVQCNSNYIEQTNRANEKTERCALTGKGIRYWEVIPDIFDYRNDEDHTPCPFAGPEYQWMRNLTVCWEYAKINKLQPAFVVVYAEGKGFPMAQKAKSEQWGNLIRKLRLKQGSIVFDRRSFQEIIALAQNAATTEADTYKDLADCVQDKIEVVCGMKTRR